MKRRSSMNSPLPTFLSSCLLLFISSISAFNFQQSLLNWFKEADFVAQLHAKHVASESVQHMFKGTPLASAPDQAKIDFANSLAGQMLSQFMVSEQDLLGEWKVGKIVEAAGDDFESETARRGLLNVISSNQMTIFSFVDCPWCLLAKKLLKEEYNLTSGDGTLQVVELEDLGRKGKHLRAAIAIETGRTSMPAIFIGERAIGGYTDGFPGLQSLHESAMEENPKKKAKVGAESEEAEPITKDGDMPQKKFYRSRAHCNPLSHNDLFDYPVDPSKSSWEKFYPNHNGRPISFIDVGCGFGGLTVSLAKEFPDKLVLGMEIRPKVTEYVRLRIEALRKQNPGEYQNAAVLRTNAMRYLPNFFKKGEIEKMFFCFPDPHFKAKNHRRRIVNTALLGEYAHFLRPGGRLYAVTDVEDLHNWHVEKCTNHPCFRPLTEEEMAADPCVTLIRTETEESKKVERAGSGKYHAVFERVPDAAVRAPPFADLFRDFLPPF